MEQKKQSGEYRYSIRLSTQIGTRRGELFLSVTDDHIDGIMDVLGQKQCCSGKICEDGSCILSGQLKTMRSVFDYTARGYFDENHVSLDLKYSQGVFRLTGQRLEQDDCSDRGRPSDFLAHLPQLGRHRK